MIVLRAQNCVNRALQTGTILHLQRVVVAWVLFFGASGDWILYIIRLTDD